MARAGYGKLHLNGADVVFPYLIIQPRMVSNNDESKVVL